MAKGRWPDGGAPDARKGQEAPGAGGVSPSPRTVEGVASGVPYTESAPPVPVSAFPKLLGPSDTSPPSAALSCDPVPPASLSFSHLIMAPTLADRANRSAADRPLLRTGRT